ncbi:LuxR C-terminal-related transcriptional regulator [Lentzea chajnantorensis]
MSAPSARRPRPAGAVPGQVAGRLVGREREVAALAEALGAGRSCVVHGAVGTGKSALLAVASSIAVRSGLTPVRAWPGADRRAVLVVDDADQLPAEQLQRLARFRGPVLVAGDLDPDAVPVLLPDAERVAVRPVGAEAVAELVRRRAGAEVPPEVTRLFLRFSGGAAGVLSDALDLVAEGGLTAACLRDTLPSLRLPRLLRAVRRRWDSLDAGAVAVGRALAVLGETSLDVLCEVAGTPSLEALAAFERLVDARVAADGPMRVCSPALGHAVRHEMAPQDRERLHRTAARVLHRRRDTATAVAGHVVACAEPVAQPWVAPVLSAAARLHRAAGRAGDAARCLRAAVREPMDDRVAAEVADGLAELHLRCGVAPRAGELGRLAGGDRLGAVVLDWQCDEELLGLELGPVASAVSAAHAGAADRSGGPALRAFWLSLRGDGAELAEQVLGAVADGAGDAVPDLVFAGLALLHSTSDYAAVLLELVPRLRARLVGAEDDWLVALEAWAHRANGDHTAVSRLVRELTARTSPARGCAALGAAAFAASAVDGGVPDEAAELLGRLGYAGTLPPAWVCTTLLHHRGRMHLELGSPRAALADATECGERLALWRADNPAIAPWRLVAAAAKARLGARATAREPVRRIGAAWGRLTPHESRIVRLALAGETNRAIATRFGVTQRAVELHLTRVYRKTGISRRVQLSAVFGD